MSDIPNSLSSRGNDGLVSNESSVYRSCDERVSHFVATTVASNGSTAAFRDGTFGVRSTGMLLAPGKLQSNPFFVKSEDTCSNVLAKPRLTLKPSCLSSKGPGAESAEASQNVVESNLAESSATNVVCGSTPVGILSGGESPRNSCMWSSKFVCKPSENEGVVSNPFSRFVGDGKGPFEIPKTEDPSPAAVDEQSTSVFGSNVKDRVDNFGSHVGSNGSSSKSSLSTPVGGAKQSDSESDSSDKGEFVFGQNLGERVTNAEKEDQLAESNGSGKCRSLEDAASEYEKLKNSGPILPEVDVFTGEEGESNVMQSNSRLFWFDKDRSNWVERGRGLLRLNDRLSDPFGDQAFQSRIVMRTSGILKVILNTKVWSGMLCEKVNQKSLRITGMEDGAVKVFLVTGTTKDTDGLLSAVTHRIERLKRQEDAAGSVASAAGCSFDASDSGPAIVRKRCATSYDSEEGGNVSSNVTVTVAGSPPKKARSDSTDIADG